MTGSMRYDQIDGYEPAPPEPAPLMWGYVNTDTETPNEEPTLDSTLPEA